MFHAPIPPDPEAPEFETREMVRKYLSLPVTIVWNHCRAAGEIKNLSDFGALVQSSANPPKDATIGLIRGSQQVEGRLVRSDGGLLGLRFTAPIVLRDWLMPAAYVRKAAGTRQSLASRSTGPALASHPHDSTSQDDTTRLMEDLLLVSQLIDDLGQALASDPNTPETHLGKIQNLDVAVQMLAAACWRLRNESLQDAVLPGSRDNLRWNGGAVLGHQA